ncbi:MAG: helix-turn-helix domain-containing protein [Bacteroidota bacterium]
MSIQQQLIFLFSALGGINGALLSAYFLFKRTDKRLSDYFLGGLLLMLSFRTIKSVFLFYNRDLFEVFIQFGIACCSLIGPFLFLYVKSLTSSSHRLNKSWWLHVVPYPLIVIIFSYYYSYYEDRKLWGWFIESIYVQWGIYVFISAYLIRALFVKVWQRKKLENHEFWLLNVFTGTFLVWLAYETSSYTSYIVGALTFTFLLYTSILLWFFKRSNRTIATDPPLKYANSTLTDREINKYKLSLDDLMAKEKLYKDPDLKLNKLSEYLSISGKELSQVINQTTGQNYSQYIAQQRVEEAKKMLIAPQFGHYKIAAIAHESGFNSLSSFNTYFKKIVGVTAREYKKTMLEGQNGMPKS